MRAPCALAGGEDVRRRVGVLVPGPLYRCAGACACAWAWAWAPEACLAVDGLISALVSATPPLTPNPNGGPAHTGSFWKFMSQDLDADYLPVWLQRAGYRTMHVGKFLNAMDPTDSRFRWAGVGGREGGGWGGEDR